MPRRVLVAAAAFALALAASLAPGGAGPAVARVIQARQNADEGTLAPPQAASDSTRGDVAVP